MFNPDYIVNRSLVEKFYQLQGNIELAEELSALVRKEYLNTCDLYTAQKKVKEYCISHYGNNFYEQSKEALYFIVENEYCHKERKKNCILDKQQYIFDLTHGALY